MLTLASVQWQVVNAADKSVSINATDTPPVITSNPASPQIKNEGGTLAINIVATGTNLNYQWEISKDNGLTYTDIPGLTSNAFTRFGVSLNDNGLWRCRVSNSDVSSPVYSTPCNVIINPADGTPVITASPIASQSLGLGQKLTLTVKWSGAPNPPATGSGASNVQWYKGDYPNGTLIPNANIISAGNKSDFIINNVSVSDAGSYYCLVANSKGSVPSGQANLIIDTPVGVPSIITNFPTSTQNIPEGGSFSLNTLIVSGATSFQWEKSPDGIAPFVSIPGETKSIFSISNVKLSDKGSYRCVISNSFGSITSNARPLNVITSAVPPEITSHPPLTTILNEGQLLSLSIVSNGSNFQWYKDGVAIVGATTPTYSKIMADGDGGKYKCEISNSYNGGTTISSNDITVTVIALAVTPVITGQPQSQNIYEGAALNLSVTATGGNLNYQWKKNGTDIAGASATTYTVAHAQLSDAGNYTCVVTNSKGTVTSESATINVSILAPTITEQPKNISISDNSAFSFTVATTGSNLTYQWRRDDVDIQGATTATYAKSNAAIVDAGTYTCVVTNSAGSVISNPAVLIVSMLVPTITAQPQDITLNEHETISFSITATGSELTYQWKKDGVNIPGATSSTYTKSNAALTDGGSYSCVISNNLATLTSSSAALKVNIVMPVITTQPGSQLITEGGNVVLTVVATGTNMTYQWKKDGVNIAGATTTAYSKSNLQAGDQGNYTCIITNSAGSVTSDVAQLSISLLAPVITAQPESKSVVEKDSVIFSVKAIGTNLNYQWKKGDMNIEGANLPKLKIKNISLTDAAAYTCVVSNTNASIASSQAVLSVAQESLMPIIFGLNRQYAKMSARVLLVAKGKGSGGVTKWFVDDVELKAIEGGIYFYPANYEIGKHVIRAQSADGKLILEKTVTIVE